MPSRVPILDSFAYLRPHVDRLLHDAPDYERNVFVIMRFLKTPPIELIDKALRSSLTARGLRPMRADDKSYHPELWGNLCTYMLGCSKAVAVFEDIELREFNPNVALELGFMLALNKPCLILKERRLSKPPTDIVGRLWKEFDSFSVHETIAEQIARWLVDINWDPISSLIPMPVARHILRESSAFHRVLEALDREFGLIADNGATDAETFSKMAEMLAARWPIFHENSLIDELALGDPDMKEVVKDRQKVALLFHQRVILPLRASGSRCEQRIKQAHEGVKAVIAADWTLIVKLYHMFPMHDEHV